MIPTNLEECFEVLKEMLSFEDQVWFIKTQDPIAMHHTLGQWIRNNWGLWGDTTELCKYFKAMGLHHADDMSAIILTSFGRHLRNEPLDIYAQVQKHLNYWKENGHEQQSNS